MKEKIVIVSGGFDPVHIGHVRYFKEAKTFGDHLVVILNSDDFLIKKKGFYVMSLDERREIIEAIKYVDCVITCIDKDQSVCETLTKFRENFNDYHLIFANGGDVNQDNILEKEICEKLNIEMIFNVGGEKIQSSRWIIDKVQKQKENTNGT